MYVVYCIYSGPAGISMPSGWITRGIQLMRGLQQAGADVSIIIRGNPNNMRLPDDIEFLTGEPIDVITRIREECKIDIVYVRGHPLVQMLRKAFPDIKICLELYLFPWDSVKGGLEKRNQSFLAYSDIDMFTVIGKRYHEYSLCWLKSLYRCDIKPNIAINATYDNTVEKREERPYLAGVFDSLSTPHCTVEAVKAIGRFYETYNYCGGDSVVGCSCVKDNRMLESIKRIVKDAFRYKIDRYSCSTLEIVYPDMVNVADYYSMCGITICLYSHPYEEYTYSPKRIKERNFLTSIRVIESLGYGCIPIVTNSIANVEIFGSVLHYFSVPDVSGEEVIDFVVRKIKHIVERPEFYYELLSHIDIQKYSLVAVGKRLFDFLKGEVG